MGQKKYTLGMDEELMARVSAYADELHITRNAAINVLVSQGLDAKQSLTALTDLAAVYKMQTSKIALAQADSD